MQSRDRFEEMLEHVAAAVLRASEHRAAGRLDDAQRELDDAWSRAVGLKRSDVSRLDASTFQMLVGAKKGPAAALLEAQATLEDARGDAPLAAMFRQRAAALQK